MSFESCFQASLRIFASPRVHIGRKFRMFPCPKAYMRGLLEIFYKSKGISLREERLGIFPSLWEEKPEIFPMQLRVFNWSKCDLNALEERRKTYAVIRICLSLLHKIHENNAVAFLNWWMEGRLKKNASKFAELMLDFYSDLQITIVS